MNEPSLLYIFSTSPYSNAIAQEGLEALLVAAAFENPISCVFVHDGVFQLKRNQEVAQTGIKQITKTFAALNDFGVESIYADATAMAARGLLPRDLIVKTTQLDCAEIASIIKAHHRVFVY